MKRKDQKLLEEKREQLAEGIQRVFDELGLEGLKLDSLTFKGDLTDDIDDDLALFTLKEIKCPPGFVLVTKLDPFTGEKKAVCERP
ncbi:hypothetical protein GCM10027578_27020 [Spirosoma luteolum]